MAVSNLSSFLFFVYLLVPGFFLDFLTKRHRETPRETSLRELGRIVLGSIVFSTFGFVIIILAREIYPSIFPDIRRILNEKNYIDQHYTKIFWTLVAQQFITMYLVWLYDNFEIAKTAPAFSNSSNWEVLFNESGVHWIKKNRWIHKVFSRALKLFRQSGEVESTSDVKSGFVKYRVLKVTLVSGKEVIGFVHSWSAIEEMNNRDLILGAVKSYHVPQLPERLRDLVHIEDEKIYEYVPMSAVHHMELYEVEFHVSYPTD